MGKRVTEYKLAQEPVAVIRIGGTTIKMMPPVEMSEEERQEQHRRIARAAMRCYESGARKKAQVTEKTASTTA